MIREQLFKEDQLFLILRKGTGWLDDFYSVPAGALNGGETLTAAACREAKEEIGIHVQENDLRLVHTVHALTDGAEWTGDFLTAEGWQGEPKIIEPEKHGALLWTKADSLPDNIIPYVKDAIASLSNKVGFSTYGW